MSAKDRPIQESQQPPTPSVDALIRMHEFVQAEITRYRDLEWKFPSILLTLLLALVAAVGSDRSHLFSSSPVRELVSAMAISLFLLALVFTRFTQSRISEQYRALGTVEQSLQLTHLVQKPSGKKNPWQRLAKFFGSVGLQLVLAALEVAIILVLVWRV